MFIKNLIMRQHIKMFFAFSLLLSCTTGISPIEYGSDACDFCRMTIMDLRYGGEIVTAKGRAYKFDSADCLIRYYKQHLSDTSAFAVIALADYSGNGKMLDARRSYFLQDGRIHSPMGGNIAAFPEKEAALKAGAPGAAKVMDWKTLLKTFQ
jgi:copper chaperone NosL